MRGIDSDVNVQDSVTMDHLLSATRIERRRRPSMHNSIAAGGDSPIFIIIIISSARTRTRG